MENKLFTCLIEEQNTEEACFQMYWARAQRMGEAIDLILDAAKKNGLNNPIPRQCDPDEIENLIDEDEIEPDIDSSVFWSTNRHFFPPESVFDLPVGVIASGIEGEHDIDEIKSGYTVQIDEGLTTIEVNVEARKLVDLYQQLVKLNSSYRVFWYVLHSYWDDEKDDKFLVNEDLNTSDKIITHLMENEEDSIKNGYVTLTSYLDEGETNMSITDHKRIIIRTYSKLISARIQKVLERQGYEKLSNLMSIDRWIHHWHYRVTKSQSKSELEKTLKKLGFSYWNPNQ